jgi:hypothetical protein
LAEAVIYLLTDMDIISEKEDKFILSPPRFESYKAIFLVENEKDEEKVSSMCYQILMKYAPS